MPNPSAQFTTRARVVDLLGREQIADAPTAMGELFKNAIDAAASKVRIDYWQKERCLIVADDGLGMRTQEELINKWLVLATDSKQPGNERPADWMKFASESQRQRLATSKAFGQKGIGRLAIALLGTGTLVWTRWGEGAETQRTLLLVPWAVFRHPHLTLDQIELPMLRLDRVATIDDALSLVKQAQAWVTNAGLFDTWQSDQLPLLHTDLENQFRHSLSAPIEFSDTPGTTFIVLNTDDVVANHFEGWLGKDDLFGEDDSFSPEGPKAYLAFNNPFSEYGPRLALELWSDGKLSAGNSGRFWTRDDFDHTDHYVKVEIDRDGYARGIVRRFDEVINYERNLGRLPTRASSPGILKIEVGDVEGDPKTSHLPKDEWTLMNKRAFHFGGFYVYMDDVRVCPYGRDDVDFVGFEKRRSLAAGRYFWSHRRMFGGVFLGRDSNKDLIEKAGREGFQQNGAYRGLVHYLRVLFLDLADSYFGSKAKRPDKEERRREKERAEREARQEAERSVFLERFSMSKRHVESVGSAFAKEANAVRCLIEEAEAGMTAMLIGGCREALTNLRVQYGKLWDGMVIQFPSGFSLSNDEAEAVDHYLHRRADIDLEAQQQLKQLAARLDRVGATVEQAEAREGRAKEVIQANRRAIEVELHSVTDAVMEVEAKLRSAIGQRLEQELALIDGIASEAIEAASSPAPTDGLVVEEIIARQTRYLQEVSLPALETLRNQLSALVEGDGGIVEAEDLREELRQCKERELRLLELAQLGLVMESADHDYRSMLADADKAIEALATVVPASSQQDLQNLKDALLHIDEQLQAFDPLVRRVRGRVSELSGDDIRKFVQSAFEKVRRPTVSFEYTPKFLEAVFTGVKRPVFLGAVHNLVMNAGYWANKAQPQGRVRFSLASNGFVISDSGNGVHQRDRDRIFEPGFSRRPAGRGLGLFIARSCLQAFGYGLELLPAPAPGGLPGANFLITRPLKKDDEVD